MAKIVIEDIYLEKKSPNNENNIENCI